MNISKVKVIYRDAGGTFDKIFVVGAPKYKPEIEVINAEFIHGNLEIVEVEVLEKYVGFAMQIDGAPLPRSV